MGTWIPRIKLIMIYAFGRLHKRILNSQNNIGTTGRGHTPIICATRIDHHKPTLTNKYPPPWKSTNNENQLVHHKPTDINKHPPSWRPTNIENQLVQDCPTTINPTPNGT